MENSVTLSPAITRLKKLVERQYGCTFEYRSIDEDASSMMLADLEKGQPVSAGDWVFFPIFSDQALVGTGRISSRDSLDTAEIQRLHQIIRAVVEGTMMNLDRLELLHKLEDHLSESTRPHNVIPIQNYRTNPFPLQSLKTEKAHALNFSFLIESDSTDDIFRMAIEIHHFARRYAFLKHEDLAPEAIADATALKSLGHMTIYIENICQLKFSQQEQLLKYFQSERDRECPQIVAGSPIPLSELKKSCLVIPDLLSHLMTGYIRLNSSFANYKKSDLVEFFFNQLTGRKS